MGCAVREVWEEIGYDISGKVDPSRYITINGDTKDTVFFIVEDVKEETTVVRTI